MGNKHTNLPSGISDLAEVLGPKLALEIVLWRWARAAERSRVPPRAISLHIPLQNPCDPDHWLHIMAQEPRQTLIAERGGENITCQVPKSLLERMLVNRGMLDMCSGASAITVARRYGKTPKRWRDLFNKPPRPSFIEEVNENIAAEVTLLLMARHSRKAKRTFLT
jgi:hypothetical protein